MNINVKPWQGRDEQYYALTVNTNDAKIIEDWLTQSDVDSMAVDFLDNTVLHNVWRNEVIQRLVDLNVIDIDMMREYLEDLEE